MKNQQVFPHKSYKRLFTIGACVCILLLCPLIAMQFTREVNWTSIDFLAAAALLLSAGFTFEWVMQKISHRRTQILLALAILFALMLLWAELAVGIFPVM